MKYKVGDKVRVRQWKAMVLQYGVNTYGQIVHNGFVMDFRYRKLCCGSVATISSITHTDHWLEEDKSVSCWADYMFEGYAFEYGDEIEVSDDGVNWFIHYYIGYIDVDAGWCPHYITKENWMWKWGINKYYYARPIQKPQIEIDVKINGKPSKLSDISDETFKKLKEQENL